MSGWIGGGSSRSFTYQQKTPVTITPTIAHGLAKRPRIDVVDDDGNRIVLFGVIYPTPNTAILTFLSPESFTATFS